MCHFLIDVAVGITSTALGSIITVAVVAEVEAHRLKREFDDLSRLLIQAHDTRSQAHSSGADTEKKMEEIKMQIKEVIAEVGASREGVFGISCAFKKKLKSLEQDVADLIESQAGADFIKVLYNETPIEMAFREKIRAVGRKAADMKEELCFTTLLFPWS